jgi:hypothetical protein
VAGSGKLRAITSYRERTDREEGTGTHHDLGAFCQAYVRRAADHETDVIDLGTQRPRRSLSIDMSRRGRVRFVSIETPDPAALIPKLLATSELAVVRA